MRRISSPGESREDSRLDKTGAQAGGKISGDRLRPGGRKKRRVCAQTCASQSGDVSEGDRGGGLRIRIDEEPPYIHGEFLRTLQEVDGFTQANKLAGLEEERSPDPHQPSSARHRLPPRLTLSAGLIVGRAPRSKLRRKPVPRRHATID